MKIVNKQCTLFQELQTRDNIRADSFYQKRGRIIRKNKTTVSVFILGKKHFVFLKRQNSCDAAYDF